MAADGNGWIPASLGTGDGVGAQEQQQLTCALPSPAEHPGTQRDSVAQAVQHGHPLPSRRQSALLQEKSFSKLSESSALDLSFG